MSRQSKSAVYQNIKKLSKLTNSKNRTPWVGSTLNQMIPEEERLLKLQRLLFTTDTPLTILLRNINTLNQKEL